MAISFRLDTASKVDLRVYDVAGRLVRALMVDWLQAGLYSVKWDGLDNDHRQVAAGIYFCRLQTAESDLTQRIVLLR
jgi:flagellar hook assembly protein FlgD